MKDYSLSKYSGIIPAMTSCYNAAGEIDITATRKMTRFLIDKGVNGLYIGGSSGEGLIQSVDERKQMLEAVLEEANGEIVIIGHIGAINTKDSIELAIHAEQAGADAISAVPPFYYRCSDNGVQRHWNAIMESCSLPFIIYHIPSTTGFSLTPVLLREMIKNPQVIGVKISTSSSYELQQFKAIGGKDFLIFNGPDEQFIAGRIMGASAGIGGTYGVMPELFVKLEQLFRERRLEEATLLQGKINDIITLLLALPIHGALKEIIKLRGIDCGGVRAPLEMVSADQQQAIIHIHQKIMSYIQEYEGEIQQEHHLIQEGQE
ncbi:dihydrodipicolinate synthase family protein [Paenibacillus agricola]|uniref:N-acetylneuraminate lyase n=1 Tax=Paenibacillus agricola TaxID=2716264 RepID=A0ABX0JGG4_9BACL|nr:dihydrodipicolinate synthase family protein [Paenibacillus agricola]NHN32760.1 N-acetylneuraminate lyase [Paenibacillus agricola]